MKTRILVTILVVLLLLSTGCSKSNEQTDVNKGDGYVNTEEDNDAGDNVFESTLRKIVKNGNLQLETTNVVKTYSDILAFAKENGGYEFEHSKTVRDNYTSITAEIKIKPEKLDLLMEYAGDAAVIINSSTSSDDITEEYYDAQTRLETKKKILLKYYEFLEDAATLDDTLKIQNDMNKLTEEIEAVEGKIKIWDVLVSESSLNVTISQVDDPLKPKKDIKWNALSWNDMGTLIKNGFISVSNIVIAVVQWLIISVITISPLLIIAGIILLITKKKRKEHKAKIQEIKALYTQTHNSNVKNNNPNNSEQK
ncbi:MAG: hypothetical protein A2Y17_00445 [Clostridiales bacterium GWF2_38_85]|nr:MAG: hypothetical protein A2Y17_00445 [Clostridiales bacterium GWF2_38_85]HBL83536.1 hypothetical protein [Clostridiales bacterium]